LKEADKGFREIPLEPGAQAVLLTACGLHTIRRTAADAADVGPVCAARRL